MMSLAVSITLFLSNSPRTNLTYPPEEALDLWRAEHPLMDEDDNAVAAVKEALTDMAAGDLGRPWEEFDREFRQRHGLDAQA
jgi:hypothetical protein